MPNPKRRHSKARRDKRRAHDSSPSRLSRSARTATEPKSAAPRLRALRLLQGQAADQRLIESVTGKSGRRDIEGVLRQGPIGPYNPASVLLTGESG